MTRKAFVYKCFDSAGVLIYVGQSKSVMARLSQHQYLAEWFSAVQKIEAEAYESAKEAKEAEALLIRGHRPKFNVAMNPTPLPKIRPDVATDGISLEAITRLLKDSGKTVVQVCREAGVTRQTFYSAIKPGSNPKRETLKAIASATGLAMDQIGEKQ